MMTPVARRLLLGLLLFAAAVTALLAFDVILRVLRWPALGPADAAVLLAYEGLRVLLVAGGATVAVLAERRAAGRAAIALFGSGVLLLALAAARALTGPLPGTLQEAFAARLLARGVPQAVLAVVFVHAAWLAWLAVPPLLRFAATYPRPLTADDLLASGGADRRGAMRDVALAGADIGVLARRFTARRLATGRLHARSLWTAAGALATTHTAALVLLPAAVLPVFHVLAAAAAATAAATLIALLRAGYTVADEHERAPLLRLRHGAIAASLLVVIVVLAELLPVGAAVGGLALYFAPLALLGAALGAVLTCPHRDTSPVA